MVPVVIHSKPAAACKGLSKQYTGNHDTCGYPVLYVVHMYMYAVII